MNGLRGDEFQEYFGKVSHVQPYFFGVYSIDSLPISLPIKKFLIVNLDPQTAPGSHWLVICRPSRFILEIFNSLGFETLDILMPHFKFRTRFEVHFNKQQFQENLSTICGFFCIYFAIFRVLNYDMSFEHLLEDIFDVDLNINETKTFNFCSNLIINGESNLFL